MYYVFKFSTSGNSLLSILEIGSDAAHLYDAVMLYAWSVRKIIQEDLGDPNNGTLLIQQLKGRSYFRYRTYTDGILNFSNRYIEKRS